MSQRRVARELGICRKTVAKYATQTEVPRYTRQAPSHNPILTPEVKKAIERRLAENETLPKKQRWIGRTIFLALQEEGYQGSEPSVRRYLAQLLRGKRKRQAYIPLVFESGDVAEFDWGQVEVVLAGKVVTVQILCFRLRWSRMPFVIAYPNQRQEAMFDGLRRAFETLGGVTKHLTSDNLSQAVIKVLEGRNRKERDAYYAFRTHYLVQSTFCNRAAGNEKGSVENLVCFSQRNIIGPRPVAESWEQLHAMLWERCLQYAERTLWGESESVLQRWQQERTVLRALPPHPFDCGRVMPVSSNGTATVVFETCRYSVPVRNANQELTLRAYWNQIDVYAGIQRVAPHQRCYEREQYILDLDHYLDLLIQKPGALAQARPFRAAALPDIYHRFRAELNQRSERGDREFIEILLMHREFPASAVAAALEAALLQRSVHVGAVRALLIQESSPRPAAMPLGPAVSGIQVQQPPLSQYDHLLKGGVVH